MKKEKWILIGILLYLLVNITSLFIPLVVNAAKYAQIGREMLENQNWIDLTIGSDPYDQKPPFLFWIAALVFQTFGISVIAYKLSVLLISLAGIYGTYKLGELLYDRRTGILSAFFWATCLGYTHYHNDIHTDTLLVVPVILAIWQFAAFVKDHHNYHFFLGSFLTGLGMLVKGPITLVIVGSAVGLHLLVTRNLRMIFHFRSLIALAIVIILTLPALWGLYDQFGMEGIKFYLWTNNIGRVDGSYAGHNTDLFYYIHTTIYMIAPWVVFSFTGIYMQIREKMLKKWKFTDADEFYTIGGILFFLFISSVAKAKNPHYELVILPLIAILAARWAFLIFERPEFFKLQKVFGAFHLGIGIILFILTGIFLIYVFPEDRIWIWLVIILLAGSFIYVLTWKNSMSKQLTYLMLAISSILFTMNTNILPNLSKYQSSLEACSVFNANAGPTEKLHIFTPESRYWEIFLYSKNYGRYMVSPSDFKRIAPPVNDWIYTGTEGVKQLAAMRVPVDTVRVFQHNSMTRLSLKFLNPETRASKLKTRYLLKLK